MGVISPEPTPILYAVVKILSDHGLKKTAKKLRKECKCDKLKDEFIPQEIKEANFHKLISSIYKKAKKKMKKNIESENTNSASDTVLNGFAKGSASLKGTIDNSTTNTSGVPFKRVNDEVWLNRIEKDELRINSYKIKNDPFSMKAAEDLARVKGKNFRSEKSKKKRASWKGSGEITNAVNSISFSDSDPE